MKTDLERSQDNLREKSGSFVRDQSAEEVITPRRKTTGDAPRRRTIERDRTPKKKQGPDRDTKILLIAGVSILLVVILIFSAGKSWQRRVDKKEINRLTQSNADLQTQLQDLQKSNSDLQDTIASLQTTQEPAADTNTNEADSSLNGTTHELQTGYNFRAEANTDSEVLLELEEGTSVTIVKVLSDGWVQAEYDGETGYLKCGDELTTSGTSDTSASGTESDGSTTAPTTSDEDDTEA